MLNNIHINLEEELHTKPNPTNTIKLKLILNQYNIAFLILEALDFKKASYTGIHFTMLLSPDISDKLNKEQN